MGIGTSGKNEKQNQNLKTYYLTGICKELLIEIYAFRNKSFEFDAKFGDVKNVSKTC